MYFNPAYVVIKEVLAYPRKLVRERGWVFGVLGKKKLTGGFFSPFVACYGLGARALECTRSAVLHTNEVPVAGTRGYYYRCCYCGRCRWKLEEAKGREGDQRRGFSPPSFALCSLVHEPFPTAFPFYVSARSYLDSKSLEVRCFDKATATGN